MQRENTGSDQDRRFRSGPRLNPAVRAERYSHLAAPDEPDLKIKRKVQAALSLPLLGIHLPVRQAIDIIANAVVHVGGRWHPGIFAATGGTRQSR